MREVLKFESEMIDIGMTRSANVMKLSDDSKVHQAVHLRMVQAEEDGRGAC